MAITAPDPATVRGPRPAARLGLAMVSDERLAGLVHLGQPGAFTVLYERHAPALSRYCRSILRHPEDAADALQNTMLAALAGLEREPFHGPLRPWLYRIAHNESISLIRRRQRAAVPVADAPEVADARHDPEVADALEGLLLDLRALPERQRGALLMRELAGLEYDQIGRAFATSAVAARKLVYEARVSLGAQREGRDASCDRVCRELSDGDGRTSRGRVVRAHLDSCEACRAFETSLRRRPEQLALIPALPVLGSGIWLAGSISGGSAAGKVVVAAGGTGAGMAGTGVVSGLSSAVAVKCLTACGALALAGAGAAIATHTATPPHHPHRQLLVAAPHVASAVLHPSLTPGPEAVVPRPEAAVPARDVTSPAPVAGPAIPTGSRSVASALRVRVGAAPSRARGAAENPTRHSTTRHSATLAPATSRTGTGPGVTAGPAPVNGGVTDPAPSSGASPATAPAGPAGATGATAPAPPTAVGSGAGPTPGVPAPASAPTPAPAAAPDASAGAPSRPVTAAAMSQAAAVLAQNIGQLAQGLMGRVSAAAGAVGGAALSGLSNRSY